MARITKIKSVAKSFDTLIGEYLLFKQAQGLRETTLEGQKTTLNTFLKRNPEAMNASDEDMPALVYNFMSEDIMPATYNYRLSYLKSFFNWCIERGYFQTNPMSGLKKRKTGDKIVNMSEDIVKKLITLPDKSTYAGLRDYALIMLTLDTGIRPREAFHLLLNDFNFKSLEIVIRPEVSKTSSMRLLPITTISSQIIQFLIQNRHPAWNEKVPVFCTTDGTFLDKDKWGDRIEIYSKALNFKFTPYDLRHTFALMYLRNGGDPFTLQRIMGHTDLSMTKRYLALTNVDLQSKHSSCSPINTLMPKQRVRKLV